MQNGQQHPRKDAIDGIQIGLSSNLHPKLKWKVHFPRREV